MFGFHCYKEALSLEKAIQRDIKLANKHNIIIDLVQVFVVGPRNSIPVNMNYNKVKEQKIDIYAHGAYVDNSWKTKSVTNIIQELKICDNINAKGLIIHLSKSTNERFEPVIKKIAENITSKTRIYLEINPALPTENTFETPEKINALISKMNAAQKKYNIKLGLCIDTAHLASCGVALKTYGDAKAFFSALYKTPIIIHLNDSGTPIGSGQDIHETLTKGTIWQDYNKLNISKSGLQYIFDSEFPIILERARAKLPDDLHIIDELNLI